MRPSTTSAPSSAGAKGADIDLVAATDPTAYTVPFGWSLALPGIGAAMAVLGGSGAWRGLDRRAGEDGRPPRGAGRRCGSGARRRKSPGGPGRRRPPFRRRPGALRRERWRGSSFRTLPSARPAGGGTLGRVTYALTRCIRGELWEPPYPQSYGMAEGSGKGRVRTAIARTRSGTAPITSLSARFEEPKRPTCSRRSTPATADPLPPSTRTMRCPLFRGWRAAPCKPEDSRGRSYAGASWTGSLSLSTRRGSRDGEPSRKSGSFTTGEPRTTRGRRQLSPKKRPPRNERPHHSCCARAAVRRAAAAFNNRLPTAGREEKQDGDSTH